MTKKNSFFKGAVLLVAANFIVKFIGLIYKIPIGNLLGGEGMGYFGAAFEVYQMLLAFSTAGLPIAVSKMVSESYALERYKEVNKIFKVSMISFIGIGFIGFLLMFFGASTFANMTEMPLAKYSIMALSPAVFFFSIIAILRGYFQGLQNMIPTAITQILEALTKLIVGIGLTILLLNLNFATEYLSAAAIMGTTISTVVAATLLIVIYNKKSNRNFVISLNEKGGQCRSFDKICKELIKIAVPVTIGSFVVNLTGFLDLFLIMNRLIASGVSDETAQFMYGSYKGYTHTLYNLPISIIASINVTLIPIMSSAYALKDHEKLASITNKAFKVITIFALPCAIGFIVLPNEILTLLYPSKLEEVAIAGPLLRGLGVATIWTSLASLATPMLQAVGKVNLPILSILIGGVVKLIANYILIGIPSIGINGAVIATNLCYFTIMVINMYNLVRHTSIKINVREMVIRPVISALCMGVVAFFVNILLSSVLKSSIATILTIGISGVSYFVFILVFGAINKSDLALIPFGSKLSKLVRRND